MLTASLYSILALGAITKTQAYVSAPYPRDDLPSPDDSNTDTCTVNVSCSNSSNTTPGPSHGTAGQQVALASYIHPLADPDAWNRIIGYDNQKLSVLVANILNGPDSTVNTDWKSVIDRAIGAGKRVIGYVRTGYLGISTQQFTTRLGSRDLADWVSQIERDVDQWYELYGDGLGGIFFDEGWNDCGPNNTFSELYAYINRYTKERHPGAFTVLNPGATMPQCFENTMDTLMTFESSYETYTNSYVANTWTPSDPRKIWHIVYSVPESEISRIAGLALERSAGLLELTNDILPNPYDNLPADSYMKSLMGAVAGGSAPVTDAARYPCGDDVSEPDMLSVTGSDYSSVGLNWSSAANALGYAVYVNGSKVLDIPSTMTRVTVGMIDPGTSALPFTVKTVGGGGQESPATDPVYADTQALPGGKTVINYSASVAGGSSSYTADVLIPYAFVRLFLWEDSSSGTVGWPVNYNQYSYVMATYMVEGTTLFKYSGTFDGKNYPWAWTSVGLATVMNSGYTYTWTLPIGTDTYNSTRFVVQTQGYGPATTAFQPCPGNGTDGNNRYCG